MTINPINSPDRVVPTIKQNDEDAARRKGPRVMHFGAVRTDSERIEKALHFNSTIDNKPTPPEHMNWRMRSR
jgi:hypothetical protein